MHFFKYACCFNNIYTYIYIKLLFDPKHLKETILKLNEFTFEDTLLCINERRARDATFQRHDDDNMMRRRTLGNQMEVIVVVEAGGGDGVGW